ncbi:MAG TPA: hypothetical protein VMF31_14165 [Solirubrobacterales bacterium]|nr:hypothetical protein [Solirubrobacterales bacterium]
MSDLDEALDLMRELEWLPDDIDLIREKTGRVAEILKAAYARTAEAEKALALMAFSGCLIPEGVPKLRANPALRDSLVAEGLLVISPVAGSGSFCDLSIKGDSFVRGTLLALSQLNRQTTAAD